MASHTQDEELELSEDFSAGSKRSSYEDEQEQGLLGGWKERPRNETDNVIPRRRPWSKVIWAGIGGVVLLAFAVSAAFMFALGGHSSDSVDADGLTVRTNDYVLDPNWDHQAPPQTRKYTWTIRDQEHNPDGVYRPMILVNSQYPGPLIEVNEGDKIVVHIQNRAVNATAIHWHGIYQNGTPHQDGTVGVTQCPIAPGQDFTYEFTVNGQSGTYWWHGHQGVQTSDGLHGPLVIHSRDEKKFQENPYDTDRVIFLSDHYHDLSSALLWQYLKPDMENTEPVPESGLINGRTTRNCDDYPNRRCDNTTANVGLPEIKLDRNKSHRLRIINAGAFAEFQFQIDEHELAVTEVDGTDVHPISYHRLDINPAQRYSVVLTSSVTSSDTFWMRARMITKCFTDAPKTLQADALAVVRYSSESTSSPTSQDWEEKLAQECHDMDTTELVPVQAIEAPAQPDTVFYLRSNFEIGAYRLSRGFFNSSTWLPNARSPTLQRSIDGLTANNGSFTIPASVTQRGNTGVAFINDQAFDTPIELVVQTTGIAVIDLLISNFDDGNHPMHLHGYKYFVLAQGHGVPPLTHPGAAITQETLQPLYDSIDLSNPLRRDTASVEAFGWVLLRIVADNPGAWAFHCHVAWHTEAGLLMQFVTRTDKLEGMEVPKANRDLCLAGGIERGMGPKDEDYRDLAR